MLLMVLGAGASYDSVPTYPPSERSDLSERPPLADALFENRAQFRSAMAAFPALHPIVPLLQRRNGLSLEQRLQELAAEATAHPARYRQLIAVRYYIQHILWQMEDPWLRSVAGWITNLKSLLDEVDHRRPTDSPVPIVTFNYDRLAEEALRHRGIRIATIDDYIANERYKLFKVHGSIDWVRPIGVRAEGVAEPLNQWGAAEAVMARAASLRMGEYYWLAGQYPTGMHDGELVVPAIAIPLEDKTDFEAPPKHIAALTSLLPNTTHILVIGWRATERHFLRLLTEQVPKQARVFVACGSKDEGTKTIERLQLAGLRGDMEAFDGGFTEMVVTRAYSRFLS